MSATTAFFYLLFCFLSVPRGAETGQGQVAPTGLSTAEFRELAASLPNLPGRIESVLLFSEANGQPDSVALLTWDDRSRWQISVLSRSAGRYSLTWQSGPLDETFYVSDPSHLKVFHFSDRGGTEGVTFYGCAAHNCPDGVFSVLLYVPVKRTAFFAKSVLGKVTYSPGMESAENREYTQVLDQLLKWAAGK